MKDELVFRSVCLPLHTPRWTLVKITIKDKEGTQNMVVYAEAHLTYITNRCL